jgi:hypothetical protein
VPLKSSLNFETAREPTRKYRSLHSALLFAKSAATREWTRRIVPKRRRLLRRPLALRLVLIPCLTFLFLVLSVSLTRQVSCPVLSLVLVSLFQSRRWLGREQSGVCSPSLVCRALVPVFFVRLACARLFSNK